MPPFKKYKFSDFVEINPSVKLKAGDEYSFIEMADLTDGQRYVYPSITRTLTGGARFEEGDTLFARITPCLENGKICQAKGLKDGKGFGSTEFLVFRGKKDISDSNFVFYLSRWDDVRRFAELHMVGTSGRQRVPKDVFENLELELPEDLETQTRIASILSALDDKIELNRRTNATLEAMAQTLFKKYFVDDIDPDNLPEGWKRGKLGEICSVNLKTLSKNDKLDWISYVEISEVNQGYIGNITRYKRGMEPSRARRIISHGDTILSTVRPDRGSYFLSINPESELLVSTGFAVFTPSKAPYSFVYLFLTQEESISFYGFMAHGAAYPAINPEIILKMEVLIPPKKIFDEFHSKVESMLLKFNFNINESKYLSQIRDSLLPKLMSGEIDVSVAEEELINQ